MNRKAACLSCLLLAGLMVTVSGAVQAGRAVLASGRGNPWINLRDGTEIPSAYAGEAALIQALEQGLFRPQALAAGDLDEDGVPDLVAGYAGPEGQNGVVAVYRGNAGAIYPTSTDPQPPFLEGARVFDVAVPPEFLAVGDWNGDGHLDLVAAVRGGDGLCLLPGDGQGAVGSGKMVPLPGCVTALLAGELGRRDGSTDLVVGIAGPEGAQVLVFAGREGALLGAPESVRLAVPAEATALALGHLDDDHLVDLAVAAGRELFVVHGPDPLLSMEQGVQAGASPPAVERRSFALDIVSMAMGDFAGDHGRELALLFADGTVDVLDRPAGGMRVAQLPMGDAQSTAHAPCLLATQISSLPKDDLIVLDGAGRRLQVLMMGSDLAETRLAVAYPGPWPPASDLEPAAFDLEREAVAVLPMRLNQDALSDLVILREGAGQPLVILTAPLATFTVDSTGDGGDSNAGDGICDDGTLSCTLRAAIEEANALSGTDLIQFNIGGTVPHTISPTNSLVVEAPVTIDATTQPGFAGSPVIELDGSGVGYDVLVLAGGGTTVRGLVVNRAGVDAFHVEAAGSNIIEGNYIGTDASGTSDLGNGGMGIRIDDVANNTIGGTTDEARNVIAGNGAFGIHIQGSGATWNEVQGNYIGLQADGASALGNVEHGVLIEGAPDNTIGGVGAGGRNVVSGNGGHGVVLTQVGATGNLVRDNYIGTDVDGTGELGNTEYGVLLFDAPANTIEGNVISGNHLDGVVVYSAAATANVVLGNYIGTVKSGTAALPNYEHGVVIDDAPGNTIGGASAGEGNLIAGNGFLGILITGADATGNRVEGNCIGTDEDGTGELGNGWRGVRISGEDAAGDGVDGVPMGAVEYGPARVLNSGDGMRITKAPTNTVKGNTITSNAGNGLVISGTAASGTRVQGNWIGTNPAGAALGNSGDGVIIHGASNTTIGGDEEEAGNTIAHNGGAGVSVREPAEGNRIRRNSIHSNGGLGIDLGADGPTANDPGDADGGANCLQNWPEIAAAGIKGNDVEVILKVDSQAAHVFPDLTIEFFLAEGQASGAEGKTYLGKALYTEWELQDTVTRVFSRPQTLAVGDPIVATATDDNGNTSEFSYTPTPVLPPAVNNLESKPGTKAGEVKLSWTAPSTQVQEYAIRYSKTRIDEGNWMSATEHSVVLSPTTQVVVSPLVTGTQWHFAVKAGYQGGKWSVVSNVPSLQEIGFRPNPDGYKFTNYRSTDAETAADFAMADMRRMFGDNAVCASVAAGKCTPKRSATRFMTKAQKLLTGGHCVGLSVTSLRFLKGVDSHPNVSTTYGLALTDTVVAKPPAGANYTTTVRKAIAYHHVEQVLDPVKARKNARVVKPSLVLEQLRLAMTGTVSDPVVLLWSRPLTAGHAVTPYALEGRTGSQWRVWIYDNESPGMSQLYVDFDTVKETWSYWWGPASGTETTKNLATVGITEFAKRPVFPSGAGGAMSAAGPASTSPSGLVWMSGGGHLRITDSQGRQIGFVGDVFLNEIPGAYETPLSAASDAGMEPLYTLPLTETYTILIDGQTLTETGAVDVTQFGPGYAAWVEDVTLAPTSQEALVIANDGTQLAYSSNEGQEATLTLALDDVDQSHQLQIQGADVGAGQVVSLTAETGIGHVAFSSAQAGGGEYNLEVIRASAAGEQRFFHMGLIIAAADTHYADYGAWDGAGPLTLYVDHDSDGSIDETWELANHANRVYLPVVFRSG